jgi:hypothetical protein
MVKFLLQKLKICPKPELLLSGDELEPLELLNSDG